MKYTLGAIISKYWGFVLFLLGLCFHAIWTYMQVGEHGKRLDKIEEKADSHGDAINTLKSTLDSMDSKLDILVDGYNTNGQKRICAS